MRAIGGLALAALLSAAAWFGWMGWDDEYQIDPATGYASGPYEAWQVIGSALTIIVLVVVATLLARGWVLLAVPVVVTLAYTVAWCITSLPRDESGLALVGAVLVLIGVGFGTSALAAITYGLSRLRR